MTSLDNHADLEPRITTGPITGSRKAYVHTATGLRVPVRRIELSTGEHFDVYDTSGPYTDSDARIDVHSGLVPRRAGWSEGCEHRTQLRRCGC